VLFLAEIDYFALETTTLRHGVLLPLQEAVIPAQEGATFREEIVSFLRELLLFLQETGDFQLETQPPTRKLMLPGQGFQKKLLEGSKFSLVGR
jgi:hypothetical protein